MIYRADIIHGDARDRLRELAPESVQCVVTSPPYWGLRDYGTGRWEGGAENCEHRESSPSRTAASQASNTLGGSRETVHASHMFRAVCLLCGAERVDRQLGLERTPEEYVANIVEVFREVRRVLRPDGTLWLNLGDSYSCGGKRTTGRNDHGTDCASVRLSGNTNGAVNPGPRTTLQVLSSLKPKDLIGIPWRVALALQQDGWWLRSDIVWSKPNPMPESVTDRPTKAHEYLFLLTKSEHYFYDADAIREPHSRDYSQEAWANVVGKQGNKENSGVMQHNGTKTWAECMSDAGRNRRTVWTIATQPFPGAHFAVMPEALVDPCILAGSRHGDLILDPFAGAGTVGVVALKHGRAFVGVELNPKYAAMARNRICDDAPLLNRASVNDGEAA